MKFIIQELNFCVVNFHLLILYAVGNYSSNDCSAVSGILGTLVGILAVALIGCITAIIILIVLYIKQTRSIIQKDYSRNEALPIQSKLQAIK